MNNTFSLAALASVEKIINSALRYDSVTRAGLASLTGKVIQLDMTSPRIRAYLIPVKNELKLQSYFDGNADICITGSLLSLARLSQSDIHNLKDSGVSVAGDLTLLASVQQLIKNIDIDWEEILCQLTGDIVGHQTAQLIRTNLKWFGTRITNVQRLGGEFLTEELRAFPSKMELENFYQQVDELHLAVDRAAARVEQVFNKSPPAPLWQRGELQQSPLKKGVDEVGGISPEKEKKLDEVGKITVKGKSS